MIKPGTQIFYLCDTQPPDHRRLPHPVVAGPYLTLEEAKEQAKQLWHFRGRIVQPGVAQIRQAAHGARVAQLDNGSSYLHTRSAPDHGTIIDKVGADLFDVAEGFYSGTLRASDVFECDDPQTVTSGTDPNTGRRFTTTHRDICAEHLAAWYENDLGEDVRILGRVQGFCSECQRSSS